ncbi:sugar phosphate isomerase/epimerase [Candidatus Calescamantes bacterium]|nr:sugar phosphate isomerase/epimerase [Candidatus Calescamantes bacterium]
MKSRLAFMASLGFSYMEPEEVVRILSQIGYEGVEWTLAHLDPRKRPLKEIERVVYLTHEYNMEISEVVVQQDLVSLDEKVRKERIEFVLMCIDIFSEVGIKTINLFTGPAPWDKKAPRIPVDISEGKAWDMVFEAYEKFVHKAEVKRMNLAVEGVWGMLCHDYYTTKTLIDRFNSPYLGVNFDPSHDILAGNLDVGWIIKQWGRRIKHIHLKDAVGIQKEGKFIFPLLGEGNVDWKSFFSALDEINYQGFMSVEFESFTYYHQVLKGNVEESARISMENIERLFSGKSNLG